MDNTINNIDITGVNDTMNNDESNGSTTNVCDIISDHSPHNSPQAQQQVDVIPPQGSIKLNGDQTLNNNVDTIDVVSLDGSQCSDIEVLHAIDESKRNAQSGTDGCDAPPSLTTQPVVSPLPQDTSVPSSANKDDNDVDTGDNPQPSVETGVEPDAMVSAKPNVVASRSVRFQSMSSNNTTQSAQNDDGSSRRAKFRKSSGSMKHLHDCEQLERKRKAWIAWVTVSLAFGYAFFVRVAPSGIVSGLKDDFGVSNSVLGTLGAEYYYLYVLNQVPVGAAISKWGVRRVLMALMSIGLLGSIMFAVAPVLAVLHIGRLMSGIGVSSAFLSFITVVKEWFDPHEAALMMGLSMCIGVFGAILGQSPLSAMADAIGWRVSLLLFCAVPAVVVVSAWRFMDDFGPNRLRATSGRDVGSKPQSPSEQWAIIRRTKQVWVAAAVGFFINTAIMSFSGLWATPFFQQRYGISSTSAGLVSSAAFLGNAVGSPLFGKISDRYNMRKSLVIASMAWQLVAMVLLIYTHPPVWLAAVLCFIVGAGVNVGILVSTVRSYMRSIGIERTVAFASGVMNTFFLSSPIALQSLVGGLLDGLKDGEDPSDGDYKTALSVFPACLFIGIIVSLFLRTRGLPNDATHAAATAQQLALELGVSATPALRGGTSLTVMPSAPSKYEVVTAHGDASGVGGGNDDDAKQGV